MVLRFLLWCVGIRLAIANRFSSRLRAQLTRNIILTVNTKEGVSRSYIFRERCVYSHVGISPQANCTLTFVSAAQGARIFLASNAIELIVDGLGKKLIELQGDPTGVLWFYEMVFGFLPWRKTPSYTMPDSYVTPNPNGKVADRITREPVLDELDPSWTGAVRQREKLVVWQVGKGASVSNKPINFKHVVDVSLDTLDEQA